MRSGTAARAAGRRIPLVCWFAAALVTVTTLGLVFTRAAPVAHAGGRLPSLAGFRAHSTGGAGNGDAPAPLYLTGADSNVASFWHDIPLSVSALVGEKRSFVPMVVEIPAGTLAKMEISTREPWTPIAQDVTSAGVPRFYPLPSVFHYGAVPRTYEHPRAAATGAEGGEGGGDLTGLLGDGDPVDIVDISPMPAATGDVYWVRVLGALAMIDGGELDWKIVGIRATDPRSRAIGDLADILGTAAVRSTMAATAAAADAGQPAQPRTGVSLRGSDAESIAERALLAAQLADFATFLRDYKKKKADDKPPVSFGYGGAYLDSASAVAVLRRHHLHWCLALTEAAGGTRVAALTYAFHGYQAACDEAHDAWRGLPGGSDDLGGISAAAKGAETLWFPVDAAAAADVTAGVR